jgi:hypothetical protein
MFNQLGKYQVKDMNVYIEPLIDKLLELWKGITMYDISRPVGAQRNLNSMQCLYGQFTMPQG